MIAPLADRDRYGVCAQIANQYWALDQSVKPYDPKVIEDIYFKELSNADGFAERIVVLELSSYLEQYA